MDNYIESLFSKYRPIIQKIINENSKFYAFKREIEWEFFVEEKIAIWAYTKDFKLYINLYSVDFAYQCNEPLHVEYFILHEIRHIYQHNSVKNLEQSGTNNQMIAIWKNEFDNYISMNEDVNNYFDQCVEFDAFSFAFAIIKHKYGDVSYIHKNIPKLYMTSSDFEGAVMKWMEIFKIQKL